MASSSSRTSKVKQAKAELAETPSVLSASWYSLNVHAHHHAQGGVPCHGKVVPVVPQPDGVQPVLHSEAGGEVEESPVEGRLGEPGAGQRGQPWRLGGDRTMV